MDTDKDRKARALALIEERFEGIPARNNTLALSPQCGMMALYLVPLQTFEMDGRLDFSGLDNGLPMFSPIGSTDSLEQDRHEGGLKTYDQCNPSAGYTYVDRNGVVEVVKASLPLAQDRDVYPKYRSCPVYYADRIPETVCRKLSSYMQGLKTLEVHPPVLLQIALSHIKNTRILTSLSRQFFMEFFPPYLQDKLWLPCSVINDYRDDLNYNKHVAEPMHHLWKQFGFGGCPFFDENGTLRPLPSG